MIKKITSLLLLLSMALAVSAQSTSATYNRVTIKDSIRFRGVWYKVWPTGGGGGGTSSGADSNLATAPLTATGNYTHNWAGFSTVISNASSFVITTTAGGDIRSTGSGSDPLLAVGINRALQKAYIQSNRAGFTSEVSCNDGIVRNIGNSIDFRISNYSVQPVNSLLALSTPANGTMAWVTPGAIVSSGGGATAGQYWATGGNANPPTTDFTLGSLTAEDVRFVTGTGGNEVMRLTKTGGVGVRTNSPNSSLDVGGSFGARLLNIFINDGGTYTVGTNVNHATGALTYVIDYDGSGTGTFALPVASNAIDRLIVIKRNSTNLGGCLNVTVDGGGLFEDYGGSFVTGMCIDPNTTTWYQSDGTKWWLLFSR